MAGKNLNIMGFLDDAVKGTIIIGLLLLLVVSSGCAWLKPPARQLTTHTESDRDPAWSPDGRKIAFVSRRVGNNRHIWAMDSDGSNQRQLTTHIASYEAPVWSPDGKKIAFGSIPVDNWDIWVLTP